jgi:serine phosphatase RsbU (regulator of sigma subunit)/PAS domain-containing protein/anti-sigma regulatory factor (Ser/Thr protein kinase)
VVVLLLIAAALAALVLQARHEAANEARDRSTAVAKAFAHSPGIVAALESDDPTSVLQPLTEEALKGSKIDVIEVISAQGIRYTHTDPAQIGKHVDAPLGEELAGRATTQTVPTPQGRAVISVVPVVKADGSVVGLVAVGITVRNVNEVVERHVPMLLGSGGAVLLLATGGAALVSGRLKRQTHGLGPTDMTRMYEHDDAVLHAVREGVLIIGGDGRLLLANDEARRLLDLPPDAERRHVTDLGLDTRTAELLASGRPATDEVLFAGDRLLAVNIRPTDAHGGPPGSVATLRDTTELQTLSGRAEVARERLKLLYDAGVRVGTTLDVVRTAQELAEVAVPRFADLGTVDLLDPVLRGDEPTGTAGMRRVAGHGLHADHPLIPVGELITWLPATPMARGLVSGRAVLEPDLASAADWQAQDPERASKAIDYGIHSLITVPMQARGVALGLVNFWRAHQTEPFEEDDMSFAEELAARAAVSIDNARRYTREHTMAVTLQRSLLPRALPEQSALELAYRYLPAQAGVGGDWFDVIPLSGSRVALVVGDVVGHGVHVAATMGRLRTAVHNFSSLDLAPDELLGHLDELVTRIDQDEATEAEGDGITGATCLYAIYDPVSGRCTVARAGHPGPALVRPDGTVDFPELPGGPPLGVGGLPFEAAELRLSEGSRLVLYTDGLVEDRDRDIDAGLETLRAVLADGGDRSPEETCRAVLDALPPGRPSDDIVLLVARTRLLDPAQVAEWDVPSDPAAVSRVRAECGSRLEAWGLEEIGFVTDLILSELITNAIRYGSQPIRVRLLRDRTLTCEVSDGSSTSPHLRYAATTDEGGRGLFLVAQFAESWGTRYTEHGKVIWSEQSLTAPQPQFPVPDF